MTSINNNQEQSIYLCCYLLSRFNQKWAGIYSSVRPQGVWKTSHWQVNPSTKPFLVFQNYINKYKLRFFNPQQKFTAIVIQWEFVLQATMEKKNCLSIFHRVCKPWFVGNEPVLNFFLVFTAMIEQR